MDNQKAVVANHEELLIAKLNAVKLGSLDAQVDEKLLQGLLVRETDNDKGLAIQSQLDSTRGAKEMLSQKERILQGMLDEHLKTKNTLQSSTPSK